MLILDTTEEGKNRFQLRAEEQTVWRTHLEIAEPKAFEAKFERRSPA